MFNLSFNQNISNEFKHRITQYFSEAEKTF